MKISIKHKESNKDTEAIAELWVNIMLAQIKANKTNGNEITANLAKINESCPPGIKDIV